MPAAAVPGGGACLLPHLPTLLLACLLAPYPPSSFPSGEGGFLVFLCKGLRPLHPRWLNPGGTYSPCQAKHPAGWLVFFLACQPCFWLAFLPPIPPPPFPSGEGGFLVFLCKGLRPLHSRWLNPGGTYSPCQAKHPAGWLVFFLARRPDNPRRRRLKSMLHHLRSIL